MPLLIHSRKIAAALALVFLSLSALWGQSTEEEFIELKNSALAEPEEALLKAPKGDLNLSVGTNYSYSKSYGSVAGLYAAPGYSFPLGKSLALHGGLVAASYHAAFPGLSAEHSHPENYASLSMYVAASYKLNERLILHGAGVKQLMQTPLPGGFTKLSDQLSVGALFKLNDKVSIGARVQLQSGNGYYPGSFGRTIGFGNSFGNGGGGVFGAPFFPPPYNW